MRLRIAVSAEAQHRQHIPNVSLPFYHPPVDDPGYGCAVLSAVFIAKHIAANRRGIPPGLGIADDEFDDETMRLWMQHMKKLIVDLPAIVGFLPGSVISGICSGGAFRRPVTPIRR